MTVEISTAEFSRAVVLGVRGLSKRYRLYETPRARLRALLGLKDNAKEHWALSDVSFSLCKGQCLGVIGDNGAGKSTLLKLLAGTLQPSHGSLCRQGRVTAILELGAGFHPEFTGRQNLEFSGSLIGLSQAEVQTLATEIIQFSELGEAIDRPVKTYSSGMVVRLAFALVTAQQPEVLIIDEALAVGDQNFQKKCIERIERFRKNGCTVLFCSHSLYHVRQLCDQVLWLDKGQSRGLGDTESVLSAYEMHVRMQENQTKQLDKLEEERPAFPAMGKRAAIHRVVLHNIDENKLIQGQDVALTIEAIAHESEPAPSIGVMLEQMHGVGITSLATHAENCSPRKEATVNGWTTWQIELTFTEFPLHSGHYVFSFYLFDAVGLVVYDEWKDYIEFQWVSPSLTPGLVRLPHRWM